MRAKPAFALEATVWIAVPVGIVLVTIGLRRSPPASEVAAIFLASFVLTAFLIRAIRWSLKTRIWSILVAIAGWVGLGAVLGTLSGRVQIEGVPSFVVAALLGGLWVSVFMGIAVALYSREREKVELHKESIKDLSFRRRLLLDYAR